MTIKKVRGLNARKIIFNGAVVIALIVIAFYFMNPKQGINSNSPQTASSADIQVPETDGSTQEDQSSTNQDSIPEDNASTNAAPQTEPPKTASVQDEKRAAAPSQNDKVQGTGQVKKIETEDGKQPGSITEEPQPAPNTPKEAAPAEAPTDAAIKILKSEVTSQAKFYPYKIDDITMEVIAVKAGDGTIRTALNTCQVCFDSGRGYYVQEGETLVCQNCGNKFHIDQVEKVKGGCNPVPILEESKKVLEDSILITKSYLAEQKDYFRNWEKQ